jgi:hypothetical protein
MNDLDPSALEQHLIRQQPLGNDRSPEIRAAFQRLREAEAQWEWYRDFCETQGLALNSRWRRIAQLERVLELAKDLPVDLSTQSGADALNRFDIALAGLEPAGDAD